MRTLLLTILGCLAFTAGHAGAAQNPAPETAGAQQDAKARGAHLRMEVAGHDFGDVPRKGGDLVREFTFTNDGTAPSSRRARASRRRSPNVPYRPADRA